MKVFTGALFLLSVSLYAPNFLFKLPDMQRRFWNKLLYHLAEKESGHDDHAISSKGARTRYQLMPAVLYWYNKTEKQSYTIRYLIKHPVKAKEVSRWALQWNFDFFITDYNKPYLRMVKAISAYNTGYKMAKKNIIKYVYVQDIYPEGLNYVLNHYGIVWKGKKYMRIKI